MKFELGRTLKISDTESGVVIGRAEYATAEPQYLIRYKAADGRMVEVWWTENALTSA